MTQAAKLRELVEIEQAILLRLRHNMLARYAPYPKQIEFHNAGSQYRERLFMAGNQLGKTLAGSMEMAMHLTGEYPDWWEGRRWDRPIVAWAAGVTGVSTRDTVQRLLLGRTREWGTGAIPKRAMVGDPTIGRGVPDGVDLCHVAYKGNKQWCSTLYFKTYEQGREKWQGDTLDCVWFDEEPPADIYSEGLTRTNATNGMTYMTFTPLLGMSTIVMRFLQPREDDAGVGYRHVTRMTMDDVTHYSEEEKAQRISQYAEWEREARINGVPMMGEGRVYPVAEEVIKCDAFAIPRHWTRIAGMDFGWDHATACVWLAWDRDADVIYVTDVYRREKETPVVHAAAIRARGEWIPVAWPHDGLQTEKGTGRTLASQYRENYVNMLHEPAVHADGSRSVEAGILEILERMQTGRFKVFSHLAPWWEEFRMYHRAEGKIVKKLDDIMDAMRYGVMMIARGKVQQAPVNRYQKGRGASSRGSWMTL